MATLSAMFKLYDSYSSTVNKIIAGSDRAANAVLGASKKTDEYNESLKRTNAAAGVANTGLSRLIGTVMSLVGATKAMESADMYTNTNARLAMITDGLEEQKALQADIFASADRARGSYVDMANAAAKLKMLAGDSFTTNAEAVGFAELLTKSLKISGAGQAEQNSAFLQLTQAMTSGKLQGDEFRSVMENRERGDRVSKAYEEILQEMLDQVPGDVDKRDGSVIYDALAPCAYFLAQQDFQLENFVNLVFADTAVGEYLDQAVALYGITRKEKTPAVRKMTTSESVAIRTRWGIGGLVYVVTDMVSELVYEVTCETAGIIGNQYSGAMEPISNVTGVTAILSDIITAGTDTETDDALRERFYAKVRQPATSGNAYHYRQWALEVPAVGDAKVFPLDGGPGTVTVLVVDNDKAVSASLPTTVAEYIETQRPIGATVTVSSPATVTINVSANVLLDGSKTLSEVIAAFEAALDEFLRDTVFTTYRVSYAKIGSLLLDIPGVEDFDSFLLNSGTGNVTVGSKEIPVKGTVTLTEVSALAID